LTNARKEKGFTQEDLAVRLGVTPQAVSRWERGIGFPDLEMLYYICDLLDCSADYLLQRDISKARLTENDDEQQKKQLLNNLLAEPFMLEIGTGLIDLIADENKNRFPTIRALRDTLATQSGVLLPVLRIRDNVNIGEYEYRIMAYDEVLYSETVNKENFCFEKLCEHLKIVTIEKYDRILNRQMVQTLLDNLSEQYPAAVKGIIPEKVPVSVLQKVLAGLVVMKKPIRNLIKIVESLEDAADRKMHTDELTNHVIASLYRE
jgi:flagellar biosynthesis component FlhA